MHNTIRVAIAWYFPYYNLMHIKTHSDIIAIWPSTRIFAQDMGVKLETARQWRKRNSIPLNDYGARLLSAALVRKYWTVSPEAVLLARSGRDA